MAFTGTRQAAPRGHEALRARFSAWRSAGPTISGGDIAEIMRGARCLRPREHDRWSPRRRRGGRDSRRAAWHRPAARRDVGTLRVGRDAAAQPAPRDGGGRPRSHEAPPHRARRARRTRCRMRSTSASASRTCAAPRRAVVRAPGVAGSTLIAGGVDFGEACCPRSGDAARSAADACRRTSSARRLSAYVRTRSAARPPAPARRRTRRSLLSSSSPCVVAAVARRRRRPRRRMELAPSLWLATRVSGNVVAPRWHARRRCHVARALQRFAADTESTVGWTEAEVAVFFNDLGARDDEPAREECRRRRDASDIVNTVGGSRDLGGQRVHQARIRSRRSACAGAWIVGRQAAATPSAVQRVPAGARTDGPVAANRRFSGRL